jgi:hypothetical protein
MRRQLRCSKRQATTTTPREGEKLGLNALAPLTVLLARGLGRRNVRNADLCARSAERHLPTGGGALMRPYSAPVDTVEDHPSTAGGGPEMTVFYARHSM